MAVAIDIPEGCYLQPNDTDSLNENGENGFSYDIKGDYDTLYGWMAEITIGSDTIDGHVIRSRNLRRAPGDLGVLTITASDEVSESTETQQAYKGVWSYHASRNDVSILAYCGSGASRVNIEMWQKETDSELASAYKFKDDNGTEHELSSNEKLIAEKIESGRETVIKFYPVLTYTAYYKSCPKNWGFGIGLIRTPAAESADKVFAPTNISTIINSFSWLNVQDDVDEMPEGGFKRVLSWWGIHENDGGWDTDFYGPNRWPMPLT